MPLKSKNPKAVRLSYLLQAAISESYELYELVCIKFIITGTLYSKGIKLTWCRLSNLYCLHGNHHHLQASKAIAHLVCFVCEYS